MTPSEMLQRLHREQDPYRRRLLLIGYLTERLLPHNAPPVVVGGHAVEIYTFQDYSTHDVDLVTIRRDLVDRLLQSLGFTRRRGARHWIHHV